MANTSISRFHGPVSPCGCGMYEHPEKQSERACRLCMGRAFVAECLSCEGKGSVMQNMAGGPGTHTATCSACGGQGSYGVNKPDDWSDAPKAEQLAVA